MTPGMAMSGSPIQGLLPLLSQMMSARSTQPVAQRSPSPAPAQSGLSGVMQQGTPQTMAAPGTNRSLPIGIFGAPPVQMQGTPQTMQPPMQGNPWGNSPTMPPWFLSGILNGSITNSQLPTQNPILQSLFQLGLGGNQQFYSPQFGTPMSPSGPVTGGMNPMLGNIGALLNLANGGGGLQTQPVARTPQPGGPAPAPAPQPAPHEGPIFGGMPIRGGGPVFGNRML